MFSGVFTVAQPTALTKRHGKHCKIKIQSLCGLQNERKTTDVSVIVQQVMQVMLSMAI